MTRNYAFALSCSRVRDCLSFSARRALSFFSTENLSLSSTSILAIYYLALPSFLGRGISCLSSSCIPHYGPFDTRAGSTSFFFSNPISTTFLGNAIMLFVHSGIRSAISFSFQSTYPLSLVASVCACLPSPYLCRAVLLA